MFLLPALFTFGQGRMELLLLSSETPPTKLLDSLSMDLLQRGNPKAVLFWAQHFDVQNEFVHAAAEMASGQAKLMVDSAKSRDFIGWSDYLKKIKKPKQKMAALDSLLLLVPENNDQRIQRLCALTELKFLLLKKKKSLLLEYSNIPDAIKSSAYDEWRYHLALSYFFKTWKAIAELKENEKAIEALNQRFDQNFQDYLHETMNVFGTELKKKKPDPSIIKEPLETECHSTIYYAIIGFFVFLSLVLLIYIIRTNKTSKSSSRDRREFSDMESQWKEKEQLYNEQFDDLKNKIKELNAGNDKLKTQMTHLNAAVNNTKEQIEILQTATKEHLDELTKEPGVSQVMNLKNVITRGLVKLKDTLGK